MAHRKSNSTLCLTSRKDEGFDIGPDIRIHVRLVMYNGKKTIRTFIQAPKDIQIRRFKIPEGTNPFDRTQEVIPAGFKRKEKDAAGDPIQDPSSEEAS